MARKAKATDVVTDLQSRVAKLTQEFQTLENPEFTKSGSIVFDAMLGGGIPQGIFILWSADNGCGKSTGSLHIARSYCAQGKKVLYLDYEGGVNIPQLKGIGLIPYFNTKDNPDGSFFLFKPHTFKDGEILLDSLMNDVDLVVIDSITAILTEKSSQGSVEDAQIGIDSRIMSSFMKKYKAEAIRTGCTWIMINQIRTRINFTGQTTKDEAGGEALKFYSDVRLRMRVAMGGKLEREETTAKGKQKVQFGAINTIVAEKNRYARPKIPLDLAIIFGEGINNSYAYESWLETKGLIKKEGAWYKILIGEKEFKLQGMTRVIDWITENRQMIKQYIDSNGGYNLLMDSPNITYEDVTNADVVTAFEELDAVELEELKEDEE